MKILTLMNLYIPLRRRLLCLQKCFQKIPILVQILRPQKNMKCIKFFVMA